MVRTYQKKKSRGGGGSKAGTSTREPQGTFPREPGLEDSAWHRGLISVRGGVRCWRVPGTDRERAEAGRAEDLRRVIGTIDEDVRHRLCSASSYQKKPTLAQPPSPA